MNLNYFIHCGFGIGGGLIYRYFHNKHLNDNKDKYYPCIIHRYDANIFNLGMFYGLSFSLSCFLIKKYVYHSFIKNN